MVVTPRRRGRPRLDDAGTGHSPRVAIRLSDQLHREVHRRAVEEGRSLSESLRAAVVAWSTGPTWAERVEIQRLVRLSDLERERLFLASNENLRQLIELPRR